MDHQAIAALLGLPESATDAEITHAATVLTNRARSAEEAAADADMARFAAVIPDASKPYWRGQLISNRAAALPVLESMLPLLSAAGTSSTVPAASTGHTAGGFQPAPLHNRTDAAAPPPPGSGNAGDRQPLTEADKMSRQNSAIALVLNRNRGLSHAEAFDIARTEQPGLFQ
ncbi:MAG: hypothetical protein EOP86_21605 [Verrucomicrobiaceae bacterium]|nr:MAG: hypothetical protein EOP86_21605 [Verrucomicrobiaceae bacterium]